MTTMPPLEDAETKFEYQETGAIEILLPIEIRAKLIQTFPRLDQNTTVLPHVVELAANDNSWPKTNGDAEQPEREKPQDNNSLQQTADIGSHGKNVKSDRKLSNKLSRLRTRLGKIANKNVNCQTTTTGSTHCSTMTSLATPRALRPPPV